MKILFVFTGGTIGSTQIGEVISTDRGKPYAIISAYTKKYGIDFEYDTAEPYTELSENNTGDNIRLLAECVRSRASAYDGVIVTHGTDTLQYTAAALGYSLGLDTPPVCIVAANRPIERDDSNALDNLHGAISFIRNRGGRGAFVVYRNDGSKTVRVHRATRLVAGRAYSDAVSSVFGEVYAHFEEDNLVLNEDYSEAPDAQAPLDPAAIGDTSEKILVLQPYPGMVYPDIGENVEYILVNTYHSGTVNTKSNSAREFFARAKKRGIKAYATGIYDGPGYSSASWFDLLGITELHNLSPIAAYVKLWLLSYGGGNADELMTASLSGDVAKGKTL